MSRKKDEREKMAALGEELQFAESIVRFIFKNEDPPGPVPPGPVPPGPTPPDPPYPPGPEPTPTPGGGGGTEWWNAALTGDTLLWIMLALVAVASIAFGFLLYKKYKRDGAMVRTAENPGIGAVVTTLISQNSMLKVFAIVLSCLIAVFACTGVANAGIKAVAEENTALSAIAQVEAFYPSGVEAQADNTSQLAYADDPEPEPEPKSGIAIESGPYIDITVYKDGSLGIPDVADKVKNIDTTDGYFYSLEVSSDKQELNDAIWKFTSGNTVLYNQIANKANETNFSLPIAQSEIVNIGLAISNLSGQAALSIVSGHGDTPVEVAKVRYMADGNVMDAPSEEAIHGVIEEAFNKDGHDPTFATSVEFVKGQPPAEGSYRSKADVSRAGSGAITAYMVNNEDGGYRIVVNSDDDIICAPNSCSRLFQNFRNLNYVDFENLNTATCTDFSYMFENCGRDDGEASMLDFSMPFRHEGKFKTGENASIAAMFYGCDCSIDLTNFDTSCVVKMDSLFENYADNILDAARPFVELKLADDEGNKFVIPKDCTVDYMFKGCNYDITNGPNADDPHNLLEDIDTSSSEHFARMFAAYSYTPPVVEPEPTPGNDDEPTAILDVSPLNVSHAKDMSQMFMFTYAWKPINDTSLNIKFGDEAGDFYPGSANDKAEVNMYGFFETTNIINLDLTPINFSKVTSMDSMFAHYGFLNIDVDKYLVYHPEMSVTWPQSTADNPYPAAGCCADYMYCATSIKPEVLSNWDGTKVTSAKGMFLEYGWNANYGLITPTEKVLKVDFPTNYKFGDDCDCSYMFHQAKCAVDLTNWDASNISNFGHMFLSFGNVQREKDFCIKFGEEGNLFSPKAGASFEGMFEMVQLRDVDLTYVDLNKVNDFSYMFEGYGQLVALSQEVIKPFEGHIIWGPDTKTITPAKKTTAEGEVGANLSYMFLNYRLVTADNCVDLSKWDTKNVTNFEGMFKGFNGLSMLGAKYSGINLITPAGGLATAENANLSHMFELSQVYNTAPVEFTEGDDVADKEYNQYKSVGLKVKEVINTTNAVNMSYMFAYTYSQSLAQPDSGSKYNYRYSSIDLSGCDISKVTDMSYMFADAFWKMPPYQDMVDNPTKMAGLLTLFDEPANDDVLYINASHMFDGCSAESIDLSHLPMNRFNDISYFFAFYGTVDCYGIVDNLNNLGNIASNSNVAGLFFMSFIKAPDGQDVELDFSGLDVSEITDMSYMFFNFKPAKLDISTWNPKACTNMEGMFMSFGKDMTTSSQSGGVDPATFKPTQLLLPTEVTDDSGWHTGMNCNMKWMFAMCNADVDLSGFDVSKVTDMTGMFMCYGNSVNDIAFVLKNIAMNALQYIKQLLSGLLQSPSANNIEVSEEDISLAVLACLLNGQGSDLVDIASTTTIQEYKNKITDGTSAIDYVTNDYANMVKIGTEGITSVDVKNEYIEDGADALKFDKESANEIYNDLYSNSAISSSYYNSSLMGAYNSTSNSYTNDLKNAINEVLADSEFNEFFAFAGLSSVDVSNSSVPNMNLRPFKITIPEDFCPASDAFLHDKRLCSMKGMFALCNLTNLVLEEGKTINDYMPDLTHLDTTYVCDMSYMFTGYYWNPSFNVLPDMTKYDPHEVREIDVSSFNTANIGPYSPGENTADQKVGSMNMMFALTGSVVRDGKETDPSKSNHYRTVYKFGDDFVITSNCSTKFMFLYAKSDTLDLSNIDVSEATDLSFTFALCNAPTLDLSAWGSADKLVSTQYMFALYGMLGSVVEKQNSFQVKLGNSDNKFKLYYQKTPLNDYTDTDTKGMFFIPGFSQLDLTNVDVSNRKSLSRMFEFTILPVAAAQSSSALATNKALNISTWSTKNISDFSYMFAISFIPGITLPTAENFKTATSGAKLDYMFMLSYTTQMTDQYPSGLDLSNFDVSNATSTKAMFYAYAFVMPMNFQANNIPVVKFGNYNMTKLKDASWMFALSSFSVDISGLSASAVQNLEYMFAFTGLNPYERFLYLILQKRVNTKDVNEEIVPLGDKIGAFYTEITLPPTTKEGKASWTTSENASTKGMFLFTMSGQLDKKGITKVPYATYYPSELSLDFLDTSNVVNMESMFMLAQNSFKLEQLDTSKVTSTKKMFTAYGFISMLNYESREKIDYAASLTFAKTNSKFKLNGACDTSYMFSLFLALPDIEMVDKKPVPTYFGLSAIDVSNLTNFNSMFAFGLGVFNFDLSSWDLSKAKNMDKMFLGYGMLARLSFDFDMIPFSFMGKQLKLPKKFPVVQTGEASCSAKWLFGFACIVDCGSNDEDIYGTTLDLSAYDFSGIQDASHMFCGYNLNYNGLSEYGLDNLSLLLQNVVWQYVDVFNTYFNNKNSLFAASNADSKPVDIEKVGTTIKFSQDSKKPLKFANKADLSAMFAACDANVEMPQIDLTNVASCNSMFALYGYSYKIKETNSTTGILTIPNNLKFASGCDVKQMFMLYFPYTLDVSNFNVSAVKDMTRMFAFCRVQDLNIWNWDVSSCESMEGMFAGACAKNIDMTKWNFKMVKNMKCMFTAYSNYKQTTAVYFPETDELVWPDGCDATAMFAACDARSLMLHGLNVANFSSVDYMFAGCMNLERINVDFSTDWTQYGLAGSYMFYGCQKLTGQNDTIYKQYHTNIEFARVDGLDNRPGYFTGIATLDEPEAKQVSAEIKSIFREKGRFTDTELSSVTSVEFVKTKPSSTEKSISNIDGMITASISSGKMTIKCEGTVYARATSCIHLFQDFSSLQSIDFNNMFDCVATISTEGMFDGCTKLNNLDVSKLRIGNVENFSYMFENLGKDVIAGVNVTFNTSDVDTFDTYSATTLSGMFKGANINHIDASKFSFMHATNLSSMFEECLATEIDFPGRELDRHDTIKYEHADIKNGNLTNLFKNCKNVKSLIIGGFTPYSCDLSSAFCGCESLKSIYIPVNHGDWSDNNAKTTKSPVFDTKCTNLTNDVGLNLSELNDYTVSACCPCYYDNNRSRSGGIFSDYAVIGEPDNPSTTTGGIIQQRFGKTEIVKAKEFNIWDDGSDSGKYTEPDSNYVIAKADISKKEDKSVYAYKMSYVPKGLYVEGTSPYYLVIYSTYHIRSCTNSCSYMFANFKDLESACLDTDSFAVLNKYKYQRIEDEEKTWDLYVGNPANLSYMFYNCISLKNFSFNKDHYVYNNIMGYLGSTSHMFQNCTSLENINVEHFMPWRENIDQSITHDDYILSFTCDSMFEGCSKLKNVFASRGIEKDSHETNWTECKSGDNLFRGCTNLQANGGKWTYNDYKVKHTDKEPDKATALINVTTEDTQNEGFFTYGALMDEQDPNAWAESSGNRSSLANNLANHSIDPNQVITVEFFYDFEKSKTYTDIQASEPQKMKEPIRINPMSNSPINAYVYSDQIVEDDEFAQYHLVISTPTSYHSLIYAGQYSFTGLFAYFKNLTYFSMEPGELRDGTSGFDKTVDDMIDTSAAVDCSYMFYNAGNENVFYMNDNIKTTVDLTSFDTSNVRNFQSMFNSSTFTNIVMSNRIKHENGVFENIASFLSGVSNDDEETSRFTLEKAINLNRMFYGCGKTILPNPFNVGFLGIEMPTEIDFPRFDTPDKRKVGAGCDVSEMFMFARVSELDISYLNFDNAINFERMFAFAGAINIRISLPKRNTEEMLNNLALALNSKDEQATLNAIQAFYDNQVDISSLDETYGRKLRQGIGIWINYNTMENWGPNLEGYNISADSMFLGCLTRQINLEKFSTKNIVNMSRMFMLTPLTANYYVSEESFNTANVKSMWQMFAYAGLITGQSTFGYPIPGGADFPEFQFMPNCEIAQMFSNAYIPVDLSECKPAGQTSGCGLNNISDYSEMFYNFAINALPPIAIPGKEGEEPQPIGHPENLTIKLPSSGWTPPAETYMNEMFRGCKANVDLSGISSFSNVVSMQGMFMSYGNADFTWMGYKQVGITLPKTQGFKISTADNATMAEMFKGYKGLDVKEEGSEDTRASFQDIINCLDTSKVVDMSEMFCGAKVENIDLNTANFDTTNVRNMYYMFGSQLLRESYVKTITLGDKFKIDNVVDMRYMFGSVGDYNMALRTIYYAGTNMKNADWASIINEKIKNKGSVFTDRMFYACLNLVGGRNTKAFTLYNVDKVDHSLARPAGIQGDTIVNGYFTVADPEKAYPNKLEDDNSKTSLEDKNANNNTSIDSSEIVDSNEKIEDIVTEEDEVIELESPFDKLEVLLEDPSEVKVVALTFFQSIFNGLTKILLNIN